MKSTHQVLITGTYRCGSEFLCKLLERHSKLDVSMYRINALRFMYGRYGKDYLIDKSALIKDLQYRLMHRYGIKKSTIQISKLLSNAATYGEIYDRLMIEFYLKKSKKKIWVEKNQLVWRKIPQFLSSVTNGKVILMIRDPRAVLASFKYNTNSSKNFYLGAALNCLDLMMRIEKYYKKDNKILLIRYEDLVQKRKIILHKIQDFLNIPIEDLFQKYKKLNNNIDFINSSFQNSQRKFSNKKALSGWSSILNDREIRLCETVCGEYMKLFGYKLIKKNKINDESLFKNELANNPSLKKDFIRYFNKGLGIQKFPHNPLKSINWS